MQVFAHEKLQRPQPVSDRPEPPPLQTPAGSLVQWLHENYRIRIDSCADMMIRMSMNESFSAAREELHSYNASPMESSSSSSDNDDCVFFIHNPTVEQGWLEEGKELEFDSKELFIKHVLRNLPTSGRECLSGGGKCVLVIDSSSRVFTSTAGIDILTLPEGARISIATARLTVEMEKPTTCCREILSCSSHRRKKRPEKSSRKRRHGE